MAEKYAFNVFTGQLDIVSDLSGFLSFQGGYDADTNTPDLETPAAGAVDKGFVYVVSVAGDFFTEAVEVGDTLIAEIDDPSSLGDWIRINKNIEGAGVGGVSQWEEVVLNNKQMVVDTGYTSNSSLRTNFTLPAVAAEFTVVKVVGKGGNGWRVLQNAGQTIHFGNVDTTTGVDGAIESVDSNDAIALLCTTANTDWTVFDPQGNVDVNPVLIDPDAQIFFDAVVSAGGALTDTEKAATNTYIIDAKNNANAWWDDTKADYPYVGSSRVAHQVNMKTPGTFDLLITSSFPADHTATGWKLNGSSYGFTSLDAAVVLGAFSVTIATYSRTNNTQSGFSIGADDFGAKFGQQLSDGGTYRGFAFSTGASSVTDASIGSTAAHFILSKNGSGAGNLRAFKNGVLIGSATGTGSAPNIELYVGAENQFDVAFNNDNREHAGDLIGLGFTDAQMIAQYNARQTMNTTLSRQV